MGRKKIPVDPDLVRKLAAIHCTWPELVSILGVSEKTLKRRFGGVIDDARNHGKMSLRRKRFEMALNGSVPLLIWLSKVILGESDKVETTQTPNPESNHAVAKALAERLEFLAKEKEKAAGHDAEHREPGEATAGAAGLLPGKIRG